MKEIKISAPATVANVSCGFDVLGFCLERVADEMVIREVPEKGIRITQIEGYNLPLETHKNVAGVSALALIEDAQPDCGYEIEIIKHVMPGSGIGSSAASAIGSVYGINELMGRPYTANELIKFAIKGEAIASQCEHADNIAPALLGGFTLVKSVSPLTVCELPTPDDLFAVIVHPKIEIKTSESRAVLPKEVALNDAIKQWANLGSFVHALHTSNYDLIKSSLEDVIIEPHRSKLIPLFQMVKESAKINKALGCGISGSGPSIFTLCKGKFVAQDVAKAIKDIFNTTDIDFDIHLSKINTKGPAVIDFKN